MIQGMFQSTASPGKNFTIHREESPVAKHVRGKAVGGQNANRSSLNTRGYVGYVLLLQIFAISDMTSTASARVKGLPSSSILPGIHRTNTQTHLDIANKSKVSDKARVTGSDEPVLPDKDSRKPRYFQKTKSWTSDRLPCANIVIRPSPEHCEVMDVSVQHQALKVVYEKELPKLALSVIVRII